MADELRIMARKAARLSLGSETAQIQGAHIRPSSANATIDVGNSESYIVIEGTDYLEMTNQSATGLYFIITSAGTSAAVDRDEYLGPGITVERSEIYENGVVRKIRAGDIVKCIADS